MNIQDLLIAWGNGLAMDKPTNGYPSQSAFAKEMANGNIGIAPLPDDAQGHVDAVVSAMKHPKPEHYEVICFAYITGLPDSKISKRVRHRKEWVTATRQSAEGYIEAKLEGLL